MKHARYILHVWSTCKAHPGLDIQEQDVKRLERAELADWTDIGCLTTDKMRARLIRMMNRRITAARPMWAAAQQGGAS